MRKLQILIFLIVAAGLFSFGLPLGVPLGTIPTLQAEELQYTCGMHPMVVSDAPGLCPICQMDLTPLKDSTGNQGGQVISIDPVTSQKMGIRTAVAATKVLAHTIHTVGLVDYIESGQQVVNSRISGWVEKLLVNESGQKVVKGQVLFSLYSPELVAAQRELLLAVKNLQGAEKSGIADAVSDARSLLDASRRRLELWEISPAQIKRLESSGEVQRTLNLLAPSSGVVSKKSVRQGEFVNAGAELMEISSLDKIWVFADIYEEEIPWVEIGQRAEISFPFLPEPLLGTITQFYPYLDSKSRTVKARIELKNPRLTLKPDMYADVTIRTSPKKAVLAVPTEAVLWTGVRETVFVALGDGKFEPRQVRTGLQDEAGFVEILSGLAAGDKVVTSAQFMLDSESKLREALEKMRHPEGAKKADLEDLFK